MRVNPIVSEQKKILRKQWELRKKSICMMPLVEVDLRIIVICSRSESKRISKYISYNISVKNYNNNTKTI